MLSSVSNVSFRSNAQDLINSPGKFTTIPQNAPKGAGVDEFAPAKKKSKAPVIIGTIAAVAVAAAVTLGILAHNNKLFTKVPNAEKFFDKCKNGITATGEWIAEKSSSAWKRVCGLFNRAEASA